MTSCQHISIHLDWMIGCSMVRTLIEGGSGAPPSIFFFFLKRGEKIDITNPATLNTRSVLEPFLLLSKVCASNAPGHCISIPCLPITRKAREDKNVLCSLLKVNRLRHSTTR